MINKDHFLYCKKKICPTLFYNSPAKANVPLFVQQASGDILDVVLDALECLTEKKDRLVKGHHNHDSQFHPKRVEIMSLLCH